MRSSRWMFMLLSGALVACPAPDPRERDVDGDGVADGYACEVPPLVEDDVSACTAAATDYRPRENGSADDAWPACVSDDNAYHRIQPSISTIGRVEAFEQIADLLWDDGRLPSADDFLQARVLYAQSEGLDSRVQRREDVHYPELPGGARCRDPGMPEQYPDRCVGPAKLLPVLNDAFTRGAEVDLPLVQAARIEAALLWFLYVSPLSEVTSCTEKAADCDSSWAYYTGGTERASPIGLAADVRALGPETHERAYDATLAVRCWRDLDAEPLATDLELRNRARAQLDTAMIRGIVLFARDRLRQLTCSTGQFQQAHHEFLRVLQPLLDRELRLRAPETAELFAAELAKANPDELDVATLDTALGAAFPCP